MAIKCSFSYDGVPELSRNVLQKLVREALILALKEWRASMEAKHFTTSAVSVYNYQKRTKNTQLKKTKVTHQSAPLVFTGESKRMALASNKVTVRGNQATLSISVPDYFAVLRRGQPDLAKELTTVTLTEQAQLVATMEKHLQTLIAQRLNR